MQLFLCVGVFSQIWIIICELIVVSHKIVEQLLLIVTSLQENKELLLDTSFGFERNLSVFADVAENFLHL